MRISVAEAKGRLTDLVRRAAAGEDVVLTRHGRLAPGMRPNGKARRALLETARPSGGAKAGADRRRRAAKTFSIAPPGFPNDRRGATPRRAKICFSRPSAGL